MATIFLVNIRVGGRAPGPADGVLYLVVQLGTKRVLPSPALSLIKHTQVLFLSRIFHKFLSVVDLAHFLAHSLVVFGDWE